MKQKHLSFLPEVSHALSEKKPVVALESTIIAHGLPFPKNYEVAKNVENIIRENGAIPATIAVLDGKLKVGLDEDELKFIAQDEDTLKLGRRDIPFAVAEGKNGATTVSATMHIAASAGIKVFVTGGIGGVHRDGQNTFDISADLTELAQTDIVVVCAGAKSILDIELTLEYLETHSVMIIGYQSDEFPAFYVPQSGYKVDHRIDDVKEIARLMKIKEDIAVKGGVIIGNPIPQAHALDAQLLKRALEYAVTVSKVEGISGKALTPYLLKKIETITDGKSLEANAQLIYNNAQLGAKLALELSGLAVSSNNTVSHD